MIIFVTKNYSNVPSVVHNYSVEDAFAYCQTNCTETEDFVEGGLSFECQRIVTGVFVSYKPTNFA